MKNIITKQLKKLTLALSLGATLLSASATKAADFKLEVQVSGYPGYALVVNGSNTGGRVQWSSRHGRYITDRVKRGEAACLTILPSRAGEYCHSGALAGTYSSGSFSYRSVYLPYLKTFNVSTNPSVDNVFMWASTTAGYFEQRMPIGTRP